VPETNKEKTLAVKHKTAGNYRSGGPKRKLYIKNDILETAYSWWNSCINRHVFVFSREYKYSDDVYNRVADNGDNTDRKHRQYGNNNANKCDYRYY